MCQGFIYLHRKMIDWEWYTDVNTKTLFIHILLKANFKDKQWKGIEINRGQFLTSYETLSNEINLTVQQVRTCIKKLIKTKEITIKTTNKYSLITVENYNDYQNKDEIATNKLTNEQQSNNKQLTTTNNDKNDNNDLIMNNNENNEKKEKPKKEKPKKEKQVKNKYLEFVFLTNEEYQKLIVTFDELKTKQYIENLNNYIGSTGKKYQSHYHTILNWSKKDKTDNKPKPKPILKSKSEEDDFFESITS